MCVLVVYCSRSYLCSSAWVSIWTATACHAWATEPVASFEAFRSLAESLDSPFAYWASNSDLENKNVHHHQRTPALPEVWLSLEEEEEVPSFWTCTLHAFLLYAKNNITLLAFLLLVLLSHPHLKWPI
jgi:hypothetical protein